MEASRREDYCRYLGFVCSSDIAKDRMEQKLGNGENRESSPLGLIVGKYFQDGRFCGTDSVSVGGMTNFKKKINIA